MKKNKEVKKLRLYNYSSLGEYESWFSDMAKEGLFISHVGSFFAYFKKGEPMDMKYRLEFSYKKPLPAEQIEMYAESGWTFCAKFGNFSVFSSPAKLGAPEIYTDPKFQAESIGGLNKILRLNAIVTSIAIVFMLFFISLPFFMIRTPILNIVRGDNTSSLTQIILWIYLASSSIFAYRSSKKLKCDLEEGIAIDHKADCRKPQRRRILLNSFFLILILFSTVMSFIRIDMQFNDIPIEEATGLPLVRLAEIEKNPDLKPELSTWNDDITHLNSYTYSHSLLAPKQYTSEENGIVEGILWHDKSRTYSPRLRSERYHIRFKFLAKLAMDDLVNKYDMHEFKTHSEVYIEDKHFDDLRLFEDDTHKIVFARKGKTLIYVSYYGYQDFEIILKEIKKVTPS